MAKIERFEDLLVWQKARDATKTIYEITGDGGRRSDREFSSFLNYAHGSAAETQSHLYVARDLGYLNNGDFTTIYGKLDEISRMLMGLTKHLRKTFD